MRVSLAGIVVIGLLAGCGGDDAPKGEEAAVRATLNAVFATDDPENCTQRVTAALVRRTFPSMKACKAQQGKDVADALEIEAVKVDGRDATATIGVSGSALDGQDARIRLRKADEQWRVASIGLPTTARKQLARQLEKGLRQGGSSKRAVRCVSARLEQPIASLDAATYAASEDLPRPFTRRLNAAVRRCSN